MKYTNELGLPQAIVEAVQFDDYDGPDRNDFDISLTRLIDSPQINWLRREHRDELVEDVSDNIWALMGKSVHGILERSESTALTEHEVIVRWPMPPELAETIGMTTVRILMRLDRLSLIESQLDDYKVASVWEIMLGIKPNRIHQLSVARQLLRMKGYEVEKARLIYILRDWQMSKTGEDRYPKRQVVAIEPKLLDVDETIAFINRQLVRHFDRLAKFCTPEERWEQPAKYAIKARGRKKALRVLDTHTEAEDWMAEKGMAVDKDHYIEHRPGAWRRCQKNPTGRSYCPVSDFCPQWEAHQKEDAQ